MINSAGLTESRALHMRGVALYMFKHARHLGLDPYEAALCGWLHDFGYLTGDNRTHAKIGGELLESQGYRHATTVARHGTPQGLTDSLGVLLNIADMSVDSTGHEVGFDRRLRDIADRYGENSPQYRECSTMIGKLKGTREWERLQITVLSFEDDLRELSTLKDGYDGADSYAPVREAVLSGYDLLAILKKSGVDFTDMAMYPTGYGTIEYHLRQDKDNEIIFETGIDGISALAYIHGKQTKIPANDPDAKAKIEQTLLQYKGFEHHANQTQSHRR
ncbi:HD domain-containing protein [Bifidobacterium sp. SO1]|uniref:HD domain-containing protein n=1 Tax=Bifidobacterium sp. SO1 TaxID=2809029 RepID=UPI003204BFAC